MFLSRTTCIYGLLLFISIYILYNLHSISTHDPTSVFFDPRVGYTPSYSTLRTTEAETFVSLTENRASNTSIPQTLYPNAPKKRLCVGIPSVARKGAVYLRTSVGSLLSGLSPSERAEIYFVVFIPHTDPTVHSAYTSHWLFELVDDVLVYNVDEMTAQHIKDMEDEGGLFIEKGVYDYSYLLQHCIEQDIPYIAVFEDDVVAVDGWYHRTLAAIGMAEEKSALREDPRTDFLYLRLFYTEEFLGWNNEFWATYLWVSVMVVAVPVGVLAGLRRGSKWGMTVISERTILLTFLVAVSSVAAFFMLGRVTIFSIPEGVSEMPKYGCCSQGFVFPREKAMELVSWFRERKVGFVDVLTEEYADLKGELRSALLFSRI